MNRSITYVLFVVVGLLFGWSCGPSVKVVNIETLKPAKYPVRYSDKTVAIFNALHIDGVQTEPYVYASDTLQTGMVAKGFKEGLEQSALFKDYDIPVYNLQLFCGDGTCPDLFDTTYLQRMAEQAGAGILLIIDSVNITTDQQLMTAYDSDGKYYKVKTRAPYSLLFRFYDAEARQYLSFYHMADTLSWTGIDRNPQAIYTTVPTCEEADTLAPLVLGRMFAKTTVPQWAPEQRFYFLPSGSNWSQAAFYADMQDWVQAMHYWGELVTSSSGKAAAYAAFNMALGAEMLGEYGLALEWLQLADKYDVMPETEGYRKRLQLRLNERRTVERQLN